MIDKHIRLVETKQHESDFIISDLIESPQSFFLEINVIDILETSEDPQLLDLICNKIRKGGKIIVNGVDGLDMCRQVFFGLISLSEASTNFFKHVNNLYSISILKEYFINKSWDIKFIGLHEGRYLIEAVKP